MKRKIVLIISILFLLAGFAFAEEEIEGEGTLVKDLESILTKQDKLENKIGKILNSPGVRISGTLKFSTTDLLIFGPGSADATGKATSDTIRFRPMVQYLDLNFDAKIIKEIDVRGVFRFENVLGGAWGYYNVYGVRNLYMKGATDVVDFYVGDFQAKLSSLTLMAVEDDRMYDYESEIFTSRRETNKSELYLSDKSWPLSGVSLEKYYEFVPETFGLNYKLYGALLGRANSYTITLYNMGTGDFDENMLDHNQYLIAASPSVKIMNMVTLGGSIVNIFESSDSGNLVDQFGNATPALDNTVISGYGEIDILNGLAIINGEYVYGSYDPAANWIDDEADPAFLSNSGTAMKFEGKVSLEYLADFLPKVVLKAGYSMVDKYFTSYGAQTRMYDAAKNPQLALTQNNVWNISSTDSSPQAYGIVGGPYPFTKYNNTILAGSLLYYNIGEELARPYGDATPNRKGFDVELTLDIVGNNKVYGFYSGISEIDKEQIGAVDIKIRDFALMGGGLIINIMEMAEIKGGVKMETVENGGTTWPASMQIMTIDGALKVSVLGGALDLLGGIKMQQWAGEEIYYGMSTGEMDGTLTTMAGGIKYNLSASSYLNALYSLSQYANLIEDEEIENFDIQEIDINLVFVF